MAVQPAGRFAFSFLPLLHCFPFSFLEFEIPEVSAQQGAAELLAGTPGCGPARVWGLLWGEMAVLIFTCQS